MSTKHGFIAKDPRAPGLPGPVSPGQYLQVCIALLCWGFLLVSLKTFLACKSRRSFVGEDIAVWLAYLSLTATGILGHEVFVHAVGHALLHPDARGRATWSTFYWQYIFYTVWCIPLMLSKAAFLLAYARIFRRPMLQRIVHYKVGFLWTCGIGFIAATSIINVRVHGVLDQVPYTNYHIDFIVLQFAWTFVDVLTNICICVLGAVGVKDLRISRKRGFISWLGLRCLVPLTPSIFAIIRLVYILEIRCSTGLIIDPGFDTSLADTVPLLWSFVQAAVAVISTTIASVVEDTCHVVQKKSDATRSAAQPANNTQEMSHIRTAGALNIDSNDTTHQSHLIGQLSTASSITSSQSLAGGDAMNTSGRSAPESTTHASTKASPALWQSVLSR